MWKLTLVIAFVKRCIIGMIDISGEPFSSILTWKILKEITNDHIKPFYFQIAALWFGRVLCADSKKKSHFFLSIPTYHTYAHTYTSTYIHKHTHGQTHSNTKKKYIHIYGIFSVSSFLCFVCMCMYKHICIYKQLKLTES